MPISMPVCQPTVGSSGPLSVSPGAWRVTPIMCTADSWFPLSRRIAAGKGTCRLCRKEVLPPLVRRPGGCCSRAAVHAAANETRGAHHRYAASRLS